MLIVVAGAIGSGKSTIARGAADRLAIPFHAVDEDKRAVGARYPDFERWIAEGIPFPDDFRAAVFRQTLASLREIAVESPHAMVEETFHRASLRDPFFQEAAEVLDGLFLVEVTVPEETLLARLAARADREPGHMAGRAMYESFKAVTDPFPSVDLRLVNDSTPEVAVDQLCSVLAQQLHERTAGG